MKKQLSKPENWQDFERLCKKLWGEIWEVPNKIKRNGRTGQPQHGVDVYAIPSGENHYWGIQCKGKDDYTKSKLTEEEIDNEISKAKNFNPKLAVFIFATTSNKDSKIEEYVRLRDEESRSKGSFEILLFCWEDIVDLIEENRNTYNFYLNNNNFKENHQIKVYFENSKLETTVEPTYIRVFNRFYNTNKPSEDILREKAILGKRQLTALISPPSSKNINYALCKFGIYIINEGTKVIEDWKFKIEFDKNQIELITDNIGTGFPGMINFERATNKKTYCDDYEIRYYPLINQPFIQTDSRFFDAWVVPLPNITEIDFKWSIKARDYQDSGILKMKVIPKYEDRYRYIGVENDALIKDDELISVSSTEPKEEESLNTKLPPIWLKHK